ncbi:MAG: substrate-binding domain-containing protein [bacterium]
MGIRSFLGIIATLALALLSACPQQPAGSTGNPAGTNPARPASAPRSLKLVCDPLLVSLLEQLEPQLGPGLKGYELEAVERGALLERISAGERFEGVDAFLTADAECSAALVTAGLVSEPTLRSFAGDRLALISKPDESWRAPSLFDIYRLRFKWLAIGAEETATGHYAAQALVSDGVMPRVEERLSRPPSAEAIIAELLEGQAQLAIVPRSRILGREDLRVVLLLDSELHTDFVYQAAAASGLEDDPSVMALLTGLAENAEIQTLIAGYGFADRSEALGLNVAPGQDGDQNSF